MCVFVRCKFMRLFAFDEKQDKLSATYQPIRFRSIY